jgi:hypothetical protein
MNTLTTKEIDLLIKGLDTLPSDFKMKGLFTILKSATKNTSEEAKDKEINEGLDKLLDESKTEMEDVTILKSKLIQMRRELNKQG